MLIKRNRKKRDEIAWLFFRVCLWGKRNFNNKRRRFEGPARRIMHFSNTHTHLVFPISEKILALQPPALVAWIFNSRKSPSLRRQNHHRSKSSSFPKKGKRKIPFEGGEEGEANFLAFLSGQGHDGGFLIIIVVKKKIPPKKMQRRRRKENGSPSWAFPQHFYVPKLFIRGSFLGKRGMLLKMSSPPHLHGCPPPWRWAADAQKSFPILRVCANGR